MSKPIVALVGRPNVGKSTLFNRIMGRRIAIVESLAGTTRDRIYGNTNWNGIEFTLVDTGGIEINQESCPPKANDLGYHVGTESKLFLTEVKGQAKLAIAEADLIVFVVDGQTGLTVDDDMVARVLQQTNKPVILAVNKLDRHLDRDDALEFYAAGLGEPYPISALHGYGSGDLLDTIAATLPDQPEAYEDEEERMKIAIVGRPNVGKSSLLNKLLGYERVIVSSVPGTTRDAIDTLIIWEEDGLTEEILLIDTAGIRRKGKIEPGVEKHSALRSIKAIRRADVCLLVVDATEIVTAQDAHIAGYILEEHKGVIVVVNKWDLIEKDTYTMDKFTAKIRADLQFLDYVPVIFISALNGQRTQKLLPLALNVQSERLRRIATSELNRFLQEAVAKNPPKGAKHHRLKFFYMTQIGVGPPTFVCFVNDAKLLHFGYQRYLENSLREQFGFMGAPLHFVFRSRHD